jgi:hypothetical protein
MRTLFVLTIVGVFLAVGCTSKTDDPKVTGGGTPAAAVSAEVACGKCQYKMASATTCAPAVKIAGKTYLVSGVTVPDPNMDLCKAPKSGTVEGKIEGDKYVATKVTLK